MLFDGLIIVIATILAFNGYKRGLVASWRGPIAMVAATLLVKYIYIDFSTWIMSRLLINPEAAILIGYLMLWFSAEIILEIVLTMIFKQDKKGTPVFFDRLGGIGYGLVKTGLIIILPVMALCADIKIPAPPADLLRSEIPVWGISNDAFLVGGFRDVARSLLPLAGSFVVSENEPSFKPRYKEEKSKKPASDQSTGDESTSEEPVDRQELEDLLD